MPGKAAVVLTAAALSVTVGVLIGIVLIIGGNARRQAIVAPPSPVATAQVSGPLSAGNSTTAAISVLSPASSPAVSPPAVSSPAVVTSAPPAPVSSPGAGPAATTRPSATVTTRRPAPTRTATPPRPTATRPVIVFTTVTVAPTSSSISRATTSTVTPTQTTAAPPPDGTPAAGRPCAALGDKATATGGSTVFCQRDFRNGSLAWRAVVDGGGCLSKRMTGIGTDGQRYLCRPDRQGLDHWRRA